jgi:hypothetical protein
MITVQYKENGEWKKDDATFQIPEHAKAHTVKAGYGQYKLFKGDTLVAHLFNQTVAVNKPRPKKTKVEEPTPVVEHVDVEHVDVELDTPEEE